MKPRLSSLRLAPFTPFSFPQQTFLILGILDILDSPLCLDLQRGMFLSFNPLIWGTFFLWPLTITASCNTISGAPWRDLDFITHCLTSQPSFKILVEASMTPQRSHQPCLKWQHHLEYHLFAASVPQAGLKPWIPECQGYCSGITPSSSLVCHGNKPLKRQGKRGVPA